MELIKAILRLPAWLEKDGKTYTLEITSNGNNSLFLGYCNGFDFCFAVEGITTDEEMQSAILQTLSALRSNGYGHLIDEVDQYLKQKESPGE